MTLITTIENIVLANGKGMSEKSTDNALFRTRLLIQYMAKRDSASLFISGHNPVYIDYVNLTWSYLNVVADRSSVGNNATKLMNETVECFNRIYVEFTITNRERLIYMALITYAIYLRSVVFEQILESQMPKLSTIRRYGDGKFILPFQLKYAGIDQWETIDDVSSLIVYIMRLLKISLGLTEDQNVGGDMKYNRSPLALLSYNSVVTGYKPLKQRLATEMLVDYLNTKTPLNNNLDEQIISMIIRKDVYQHEDVKIDKEAKVDGLATTCSQDMSPDHYVMSDSFPCQLIDVRFDELYELLLNHRNTK